MLSSFIFVLSPRDLCNGIDFRWKFNSGISQAVGAVFPSTLFLKHSL